MQVDAWSLVTRIIAVVAVGTLMGQAAARLTAMVKRPFFQVAASVIECSALLASLTVTTMMMHQASEERGRKLNDTEAVGSLQTALYHDLVYMGEFIVSLGLIVAMFYLVHDGASRWRNVLALIGGAIGSLLFLNMGLTTLLTVVDLLFPIREYWEQFVLLKVLVRDLGAVVLVGCAAFDLTPVREYVLERVPAVERLSRRPPA